MSKTIFGQGFDKEVTLKLRKICNECEHKDNCISNGSKKHDPDICSYAWNKLVEMNKKNDDKIMTDIQIISKTIYKYKGIENTSLEFVKNAKLEDDMKELLKIFEDVWHGTWIVKPNFPTERYKEMLDDAIEKVKKIRKWLDENL